MNNISPLLVFASITAAFPQAEIERFEISNRIPKLCLTKNGTRCVFPFRYAGTVYSQCTYADSPTPWCATRTDENDNVITNRWGDCNLSDRLSSCPSEASESVPNCTTVSGPDTDKQCIFPFTHNGITYKECSREGLDKAWCSTKTTEDGTHISGQGFYGICPSSCPGGEANVDPTCREGATWTEDCTQCTCQNGFPVCEQRECTECTPGESWMVDCNTCICNQSGQKVCTEKFCFPTASTCTTVSGPSAGRSCVFPFKWNGQTYDSCAPWIWTGSSLGSLWCSTKVDEEGNHVNSQGNYGFCPPTCNDQEVNVSVIGARTGSTATLAEKKVVFPDDDRVPS